MITRNQRTSRTLGSRAAGRWFREALLVPVVTLVSLLGAAGLGAQSADAPGTGSVIAEIGAMRLIAPSSEAPNLEALAAEVSESWPGFLESLGVEPREPFDLYLIPGSGPETEQVRLMNSMAPRWAAGYLFGAARVGGVRLELVDRYPYKDAAAVTLHEATHQIFFDAFEDRDVLPMWFEEGAATALGQRWGVKEIVLSRGAVFLGGVPLLAEIDAGFSGSAANARLSYAAAHNFVSWSERRYGKDLVRKMVATLQSEVARGAERPSEDVFRSAWLQVTGEVLVGSERRWRRGALLIYRILPLIGGSGSLWIFMSVLTVAGGRKRRGEFKRRMERWRVEEEQADLRAAESVGGRSEVPRRPEELRGLGPREAARKRWGLPAGEGSSDPAEEGEERSRSVIERRSHDDEWIN